MKSVHFTLNLIKMELTKKVLYDLQKRLKIGNRRGVHLNAIPANSRYKFDLSKLSIIDKQLPNDFIKELLSKQPLKYRISWKDKVPDLNTLVEEKQNQLLRITKAFENLINQTEAIESEKGINTFGFGFPILVRRDNADNKLTVAPVLIWSLRIKRTKEYNTWEVLRNEDDPIYLNEILINHLENDSKIQLEQIPDEMLDDGLITQDELIQICVNLIKSINTSTIPDIIDYYTKKSQTIVSIGDKNHYEKIINNSTDSIIDFGGLFSIFEVQKQNIVNDYDCLINLKGLNIDLNDLESHYFQTISSVETDPSQQGVLHSLESKRNLLIQGPPGTGKSQTLTAVLINALENHKTTIVVCEKRTALEVLHNALIEKGLNSHCILLRDIVKDRKNVVNSVRNRLDDSEYKFGHEYSKVNFDSLLNKAKGLISSINRKHRKLDTKILGDKNWTDVVGDLIKEMKVLTFDSEFDIKKSELNYSAHELNSLLEIIDKGQPLYQAFKKYENSTLLNDQKLEGNNPDALKEAILQDISYYISELSIIKKLLLNRKWFHKIYYPRLNKDINQLFKRVQKDNWLKTKSTSKDKEQKLSDFDAELNYVIKYINNENDIFFKEFEWFRFYKSLSNKQKNIIDLLKPKSNWRRSFLVAYLNSLLLLKSNIDLPTDENEHIELDGILRGIEDEQLKYVKEYWRSKQIKESRDFEARNSNIAVENLYNKRSSNRYKRLSLRQIVQYDVDLFTTFFPVILTSPDVCCNLFKGMHKYFDIVVFDEASQLRLEDNLPAILKGKQIIIAGDEHQMPPSNYFSKIYDGSVEDDDEIEEEDDIIVDKDDIILSCETLLDFATELKFDKIHLDFHYRSKHPHLIDFSNYAFYNQRIKPLPNDYEYLAIKYIQANGTFSDHTNEAEAEVVLSIIDNNINRLENGKYPTIGIATFNIAQRNLIKSKILERLNLSQFADFNDKIRELEENGMFVKNLENIQGDERDVIILSTTYGINKDGKFAQRFGPINHSKGYKLLNVIITRAKHKIYVCTSIPEQVFVNYREHLITEGSNNKKAALYAYLAYSKAVSENDEKERKSVLMALEENTVNKNNYSTYSTGQLESPFEEEVFQALANEFGEDKLTPQFQFAGFRIDIVFNSSKTNVPKIAIECDGAKYHSSREAYLYDRHRQKILESHGFVFHRVWSTNWWRNSKRELKKLVEFIKKIEAESNHSSSNSTQASIAFSDDIEKIEKYIARNQHKN